MSLLRQVSLMVNGDSDKCLCGSGPGCASKDCTGVISPAT